MVVRDDVHSTIAAWGALRLAVLPAGLELKCDTKFQLFLTILNETKHRDIGSGSATISCPHCCLPSTILGWNG